MITLTQIMQVVAKCSNLEDNQILNNDKQKKSKLNIACSRAIVLKLAKEYTLSDNSEVAEYLNLSTQWAYASEIMLDNVIQGFYGADKAQTVIKLISEIEQEIKQL